MAAIITALLAALGPILIPMLVNWLTSLFNKVAPTVNASGDVTEDAPALVQAAHDATPRLRVFKRAFLRRLKDHAADLADGGKLTAADKKELKSLSVQASYDR